MRRYTTKEIRAHYAAATSGEWSSWESGDGRAFVSDPSHVFSLKEPIGALLVHTEKSSTPGPRSRASHDVRLVSVMHRELPALLDIVEAAEKLVDGFDDGTASRSPLDVSEAINQFLTVMRRNRVTGE